MQMPRVPEQRKLAVLGQHVLVPRLQHDDLPVLVVAQVAVEARKLLRQADVAFGMEPASRKHQHESPP